MINKTRNNTNFNHNILCGMWKKSNSKRYGLLYNVWLMFNEVKKTRAYYADVKNTLLVTFANSILCVYSIEFFYYYPFKRVNNLLYFNRLCLQTSFLLSHLSFFCSLFYSTTSIPLKSIKSFFILSLSFS